MADSVKIRCAHLSPKNIRDIRDSTIPTSDRAYKSNIVLTQHNVFLKCAVPETIKTLELSLSGYQRGINDVMHLMVIITKGLAEC